MPFAYTDKPMFLNKNDTDYSVVSGPEQKAIDCMIY